MQTLILVRHAKAERDSPTGEDFDRALSARGFEDARRMGSRLAQAGQAPDRALVSSARRTLQTWEALAPEFPLAQARPSRDLYNAEAETLLAGAEAAGEGAGTVMVVAHNPGLRRLAETLAGPEAARLAEGFPTAAAAVFDRDAAGDYALRALMLPGDPA